MKKSITGKLVFNFRNQHKSVMVEVDGSNSFDLINELLIFNNVPLDIDFEMDEKGPIGFAIRVHRDTTNPPENPQKK